MNKFDKNAYIERYNTRLETYGHDIKTLGWGGDNARQFLRFQVSLELENFLNTSKIASVLDVGCGFGDMGGDFMKNNYPNIKYTGVDINSKLIEEGKKKYPELDLRCVDIIEDNFNEKFDLVCESGIFNFKLQSENQSDYIETMINKMYSLSNCGISLDFMSTFVDFQHDGAFHMNEFDAIRLAKKFSKRVVLRNDYLDFEYAIYILKDKND